MIKKIILGVFIFAVLFIVGCSGEKETPLEDKHYDVEMLDTSIEAETESAWKCDMGKLYYIKKKFIYHINDKNEGVVYSPVGSYTKSLESTKGWALRLYLNKNSSIYLDTLNYVMNGEFPNGVEIECVETQMIPKQFEEFIGSHYGFFANHSIESLESRPEAYLH